MSLNPTYPGVYVQELPSGVQPIVGVPTSITAFIGNAKMGPVNTATEIHSWGDFESIFGGLYDSTDVGTSFMSYAVYQYYLNGGQDAIIVRVFHENALTTSASSEGLATYSIELFGAPEMGTGGSSATPTSGATYVVNESVYVTISGGSGVSITTNIGGTQKTGQTSLSNILMNSGDTISVTYTAAPTIAVSPAILQPFSAVTDSLGSGGTSPTPTTGTTYTANETVCVSISGSGLSITTNISGSAATNPSLSNATMNSGDTLEIVSGTPSIVVVSQASVASPFQPGSSTGDVLYLAAANPGVWGRNIAFTVDSTSTHVNKSAQVNGVADPTVFNLTVYLYDSPPVVNEKTAWGVQEATGAMTLGTLLLTEKFQNVSLNQNSPQYIGTVLANNSQLLMLAQTVAEQTVNTWLSTAPSVAPGAGTFVDFTQEDSGSNLIINPVYYSVSGSNITIGTSGQMTGDDGAALQPGDVIGDDGSSSGNKTGIYALDEVDIFNMLCIPPYDDSSANWAAEQSSLGNLYSLVYTNAVPYCNTRRAILIVDPPYDWTTEAKAVSGMENGFGLTADANAAVYFPRLTMADPLQPGSNEEYVPCGAVAGIIATTDGARGVWKAPAGTAASLNGVIDLTMQGNTMRLTDPQNGDLNPLGLNCLRTFPVIGSVVWGARTMVGADLMANQWKYLPIRRLALYIESSLIQGIQWAVFEPNDEPLWAELRLDVGAFMQGLFLQGAFAGTTPATAYFVKCDSDTTSPTDQANGIVNVIVGFAPLRPAEFVILKIQQMAGQGGS